MAHYLYFIALWGEKVEVEDTKLYSCVTPLALALRAIVIGIRAMLGAVIAGSVVGYEEILQCDCSCVLFWYDSLRWTVVRIETYDQAA